MWGRGQRNKVTKYGEGPRCPWAPNVLATPLIVIEAMIEEKVSHYLQEQSERSSRQCNLIIHNVPESPSMESSRKAYDENQAKDILEHLEVEVGEVTQPTRLGKNQKMLAELVL